MASPNISFDTLPSSIRKPGKYFEFNTKLAVRTLPSNAQTLCLIGQRLAAQPGLVGPDGREAVAVFWRRALPPVKNTLANAEELFFS